MSEYIHFFLRSETQMLPIKTASRNTAYYEYYSTYAPYEKVIALHRDDIEGIRNEIEGHIKNLLRTTKEIKNTLRMIPSFHNSAEEKLSIMDEERGYLATIEEELRATKEVLAFTNFLLDIYREAAFSEYTSGAKFDSSKYIYYGIECSSPSVQEVEGWEK